MSESFEKQLERLQMSVGKKSVQPTVQPNVPSAFPKPPVPMMTPIQAETVTKIRPTSCFDFLFKNAKWIIAGLAVVVVIMLYLRSKRRSSGSNLFEQLKQRYLPQNSTAKTENQGSPDLPSLVTTSSTPIIEAPVVEDPYSDPI